MNIDEFIEHTKEKAEEYKYRASFFESDNPMNKACIKVAKDHEQLAEWLEKSKEYQQLEEQDRLIKLPCKVGDTVYVDNTILPIEDMECYEDIDNKIPLYFSARVVSFRFAKRNWMKIAVKTKWLHEWIDDETRPESDYIECEKNFTILLSMIGKTVFLTKSAAEEKLKELRGEENGTME